MDKITLDREVFKALASDTRLDILKALDVRQKTVTELAKELDLNKATVFEHLEKLAAVGLIQKLEDERKWVYWQLTWTGRRLLHPEKITLALVLSSAIASLVTTLVAGWMWLKSNVADATGGFEAFTDEAGGDAAASRSIAAEAPPSAPPAAPPVEHDPVLLAAAVTAAILFVALLVFAAMVWRRARRASATTAAA